MERYLHIIWALINSPIGITAVLALVLYALNKLYAAKPGWAKYEGMIMSAVQFAEKAIDDATPNRGLRRFDKALEYIIKIREQRTGKKMSVKDIDHITEGISIVHDKLSAGGTICDQVGFCETIVILSPSLSRLQP